MRPTRLLMENACYHIYIRGNQKQTVFREKDDFRFYLTQLGRYKRRYSLSLYGYCLMPNHIHLVGKPDEPKRLPKLMQCLQRSYTAYYNKKYNKVGHLWQGRFKSKLIAKDQYLIGCIDYIELNPIRAGLVDSPLKYEFSSYLERTSYNHKGFKLLDKLLI